MLPNDGVRRPSDMAAELRQLAAQPKPSLAMPRGMMDGLNTVNQLADWLLQERTHRLDAGRPERRLATAGAER